MTKINLYGLLAEEFGHSFSMEIEQARDVFDAIDANRNGFKKRIFDLGSSGFHYSVIVNGKKIENPKEESIKNKAQTIDLVPILNGDGPAAILWQIALIVVSTAAQILLAPDPPEPPEIKASVASLQKSFTFSSVENRAAQGTPVPVCYGELIVGSEVIQTSLKSYPQNQETLKAFTRNPFGDPEQIQTSRSDSQEI